MSIHLINEVNRIYRLINTQSDSEYKNLLLNEINNIKIYELWDDYKLVSIIKKYYKYRDEYKEKKCLK